ncbi:MAG: ABC transporter related protein [Candidatus Parvarchaeum acidiphilum ARMAN-4]|jgi:ABC-2 type transport system ATP-binding protein|uniref:ABC transporter related protein n=1 Tax=Candidatus Parvarchaeum acidiphilum ARMAN-4 TaxID=662760 RepID=D2EGG3_PARA4|nr:MAG: ABC transporter related protein [Candidatus Parvarchaeum acidiphilum ARMAN-4]
MVKLIIKNLSKSYVDKKSKSLSALKKVSLNLDINGIFTLIGRNGAGKTTFIRIVSTELLPTSGKVYLDGVDVVKNPKEIRERIAVIPQEAALIPWMTARENIFAYLLWRGLSFKEAKERTNTVLTRFKLEKYADKLPRKLSGGTKRKVLVALVISSNAKIIFLDEPTTGLDPISRRELWEVLTELKKEHLVILTTHYLEEAEELSDYIIILNKGKLVKAGSINNIRDAIGYPYAIKIFKGFNKKIRLNGKVVKKNDGTFQVFSDERTANNLAKKLIKTKVKFSINPTSLEDIFYMLVGDIDKGEENEN